jgi:MFS family permease
MTQTTAGATEFHASTAYRYYVLVLLFTAYLFNFMDRQILAILMEPIRKEFNFSDLQLGMLSGIAFAALYTTLGIPIARLADRRNRVNIIAISIAIWSAFTALTGLTRGFWQMFIARVGVGIGEAGCNPAAYSILADYFEPRRRATAISLYSLGVTVGAFLGLIIGANVATKYGWRAAFFLVGLPGLVVAIVMKLTLREPPRGFSEPNAVRAEAPPMMDVLKSLWSKSSFRHLSFATGLHSFVAYGIGNFYSPFLQRSHGMSLKEAGNTLAIVFLIGGAIGTYFGGSFADRFVHKRHDPRYLLWVPAVTLALQFPLSMTIYTTTSTTLVLALLVPAIAMSAAYLGPSITATYTLVGLRERAVAGSLLLFMLNFIGLGLGPMFSGWLSDLLSQQQLAKGVAESIAKADGLRWAMRIMVLVNLWSILHYILGARKLKGEAITGF